MNPVAVRVGRGVVAGMVAVTMTWGSLMLVAWMNDDPSPTAHEEAHEGRRTVPVLPPPTPPTPSDAPSRDPSAADASRPAAVPSVTAPSPAPPQIAGLAPTAGPGGMPLGGPGGSLPSMGTLPGSSLPDEAVSEATVAARPKSRPKPRYPLLAQRQGVEGSVTLRLRIDASGRVVDAVVVKSDPPGTFDDAALQTARRYRFTPARRGGEAVDSTLQQTIRFELQP